MVGGSPEDGDDADEEEAEDEEERVELHSLLVLYLLVQKKPLIVIITENVFNQFM
jgi:hypothetical protein